MVNGATSRLIYFGAWLCNLTCIIGIIVLAMAGHDTPNELMLAMTACLGIVGGSHLTPPLSKAATEVTLRKSQEASGKEPNG